MVVNGDRPDRQARRARHLACPVPARVLHGDRLAARAAQRPADAADPVGCAGADGQVPWIRPDPRHWQGLAARVIREDAETSLRNLGADRLDLYYAHIDDRSIPLAETVDALAGLAESGKAGLLGASNTATWRIERGRGLARAAGRPGYSCVQQQHTYLLAQPGPGQLNLITGELLDYARCAATPPRIAAVSIRDWPSALRAQCVSTCPRLQPGSGDGPRQSASVSRLAECHIRRCTPTAACISWSTCPAASFTCRSSHLRLSSGWPLRCDS